MKKWIALVLVVALGASAWYFRGKFLEGAQVADPDQVRDLDDNEIRSGVRSADPKTRLDALGQIEKLAPKERKAALLDALGAPYAPTRLAALTALSRGFATDDEVVARFLAVAKEDQDADVRAAAIRSLDRSGDPRVLGLAISVLESSEEPLAVRLGAARTLDRLTGRETAKDLADRLDAAEEAADDLLMDWDDWYSERKAGLVWDPEQGRFVSKE